MDALRRRGAHPLQPGRSGTAAHRHADGLVGRAELRARAAGHGVRPGAVTSLRLAVPGDTDPGEHRNLHRRPGRVRTEGAEGPARGVPEIPGPALPGSPLDGAA